MALLALSLTAGLGFTGLVRRVASAKAAQRGLAIEVGSARPGWMSIHLQDVVIKPIGVTAVTAKLDAVTVSITPTLGLQAAHTAGGSIEIAGRPGEVRRQLQEFRKRPRTAGSTSGSRTGGAKLSGSDLFVEWTDWDVEGSRHRIGGLEFERGPGAQRVAFQSAEFATRRGKWLAGKTELQFAPSDSGTVLVGADVARVEGTLTLPSTVAAPKRDREPADSAEPPLEAPPSTPEQPKPSEQSLQVERIKKLVTSFSATGWSATQRRLGLVKGPLRQFLSDDATFRVREIQLKLVRGRSVLNFGPAPLTVTRTSDELHASFKSPATSDGQQLSVQATIPLGDGTIRGMVSGGPVPLKTLGVQDGNFGLLNVDETLLVAATEGSLSSEGLLEVTATGSLTGLAIQQDALGPEPLRDMDLAWGGHLEVDWAANQIDITRGTLGIGSANLLFDGSVHRDGEDVVLKMQLDMPTSPCQEVFEAAPEALLPLLQGLSLKGSLGLHALVQLDTSALADTVVEWELKNRCKVLETPEAVDPKRFHETFQHLVLDEEGRAIEIEAGPGTEQWVPLEEISPYLQTAVLVCEDARFFKHKGFNNSAIRDSIASNLKAGRFVRGASTLTMQLAKNLYLGREKTLSRKFQEAALTMLLEERLNKEDILELYFNVVEFGPGIYGIRQAAQHYFKSHPGELSLGQALYFGSILPNPKAVHFEEDDSLDPRWAKHLQYLMRSAHRREHISEEELDAGQKEVLRFGQPHQAPESDLLFGSSLFGDFGG